MHQREMTEAELKLEIAIIPTKGENQCRHCQRVAETEPGRVSPGVRKRGLSINYDVKVFVPLPY